MKRVLLTETSSVINGGQKMSLTVSNMLIKSGLFEVIWAIPESGILSKELDRRKIKYYFLGNADLPAGVKGKSVIFRYARLTMSAVGKLKKIVSKEKIDIIYAPGPASLPWAAVCGAMKHKPVIWHLHHMFLDVATKKLINICGKFKSVKSIIAVSKCVGSQIADERARSKVCVLYNPVDYEKYSSGNAKNVISEHPFSDKVSGSIFVGHIALIEDEKRQDVTVETVAALRKKGYAACGVFVGIAKPENMQHFDRLKQIAEENEISPYIYYLGYRNDVQNILKALDVELIPSVEGFPLAGLEACAAGVPVVACDVGGACEFVEVSGSGLCFEFDNAEDAADKIIECMKGRECFSAKGRLFAAQCDEDGYKQKVIQIFNK